MPTREHHVQVTRTARYCVLGEPGPGVREVWVVCHGYGQLAARFLSAFSPIDDGTRLIVAPEALSRFYLDATAGPHGPDAKVGASWMTREDRLSEIGDYVAYLDALYGQVLGELGGTPETTVLGFSQGAATASRWLACGAASVARLVLWGGFLPGDLDVAKHAARLSTMRLTIVAGDRDELISAEALATALRLLQRHSVPHRVIRFEGGHRLDPDVLRSLAAERVS